MIRKLTIFFVVLMVFTSGFGRLVQAQLPDRPMTYFYRSGDLTTVPAILRSQEAKGVLKRKNARPPTIGFLAALLSRHSEYADAWLSEDFEKDTQYVLAVALTFSGKRAKAIEYVQEKGWGPEMVTQLKRLPISLIDFPVQTATDLDIMWGASFATGDVLYVNRILDMFSTNIQSGIFEIEDLLFLRKAKSSASSEKKQDLSWMVKKYGKETFLKIAYSSSALWASISNAIQHPFVMDAVKQRIAKAPNSDLSYVLQLTLFLREEPKIGFVKGDGIEFMIFSSSKAEAIQKKIDAGYVEDTLNYAQNDFSNDEIPYAVVITFSKTERKKVVHISIKTPKGNSFKLRPQQVHGESFFLNMIEITKDMKDGPGIYSVQISTAVGGVSQVQFQKRFVITRP